MTEQYPDTPFGNPNRGALHPHFARKDWAGKSERFKRELRPEDYRHGPVVHIDLREYEREAAMRSAAE